MENIVALDIVELSIYSLMRLGLGVGAAPASEIACNIPFGSRAEIFPICIRWGTNPLYILRMVTMVKAGIMGKQGTVEKGKFADLIPVFGDPWQDISEMQRVMFVMKGGKVVRNDLK
jgi:imidazolonepropionase-like amidohydrolase